MKMMNQTKVRCSLCGTALLLALIFTLVSKQASAEDLTIDGRDAKNDPCSVTLVGASKIVDHNLDTQVSMTPGNKTNVRIKIASLSLKIQGETLKVKNVVNDHTPDGLPTQSVIVIVNDSKALAISFDDNTLKNEKSSVKLSRISVRARLGMQQPFCQF